MDEYILFLDESETNKKEIKHAYAIGGIIVEKEYHDTILKPKVENIKKEIWSDIENYSDIILHEKEVKDATEHRVSKDELKPEYIRFYNNSNNCTKLYTELDYVLRSSQLYTIGCVVLEEELHSNFTKELTNDFGSICMQILIENFCHFLHTKNAVGHIIYESRETNQNIIMSQHFYQLKAIGSMYVNSRSIQKYIKNIEFRNKTENITGLQLADFIPNQIAKKSLGKKIYQNTKSFNANIYRKAYDGNCSNKNRFGIRVIPRN